MSGVCRRGAGVEQLLVDQAWAALVGDGAPAAVDAPQITGFDRSLVSHVAAREIATSCVAVALAAASELQRARGGTSLRPVLDRRHVAAAVRSERYFRREGAHARAVFAPLSSFWRAADGWVRTHANYPWHRDALLDTLGVGDDAASVAAAIGRRPAIEVEEAVFAAGGVAAAVRSAVQWRATPSGAAVHREPLISHCLLGDVAPRQRPADELPAAGVRVLDLTRVIAGPVCTRYLGALGADVLRVDPPNHLDLKPGEVADTLLAKRSAMLDARIESGRAMLHELLREADVVVLGYRPGALDALGLGEERLADRHPGLVIVSLDAWGHTGPWRTRRGFDSVVQAATGIAVAEAGERAEPGALPCQLLDHGTGYLACAAVLDGLRRQLTAGGTHVRHVSLARTAAWIMERDPDPTTCAADAGNTDQRWLQHLDARVPTTAIRPPGTVRGRPLGWTLPVSRYGLDDARW